MLEAYVTKKRDKKPALKLLKNAMKRYGSLEVVVTDKSPSYTAVMKLSGNENRQEAGCHLNNRAENSNFPFRRREQALSRFTRMRSLQKLASVHSSVNNHFYRQKNIEVRARLKIATPRFANGANFLLLKALAGMLWSPASESAAYENLSHPVVCAIGQAGADSSLQEHAVLPFCLEHWASLVRLIVPVWNVF